MTVNNISVTEASGVLSETMGPKITSTESSARVEDAAIKNVEASAEDKQSYAEENVILKMVLKKYDDILNSARKEMATMNVEELAEDEKSSELCDSVTKDEQSYIEEIDILKTVLKKYDDIFNSIRQAADAEFDTTKSALELCQSDYIAKEQELTKCQNILYKIVDETVEMEIPSDGYYPNNNFKYAISNLSIAKVNLDKADREHRITQERLAGVQARYNAAKSRCDSDKLLAKPRASIESMLPISKLDISTD